MNGLQPAPTDNRELFNCELLTSSCISLIRCEILREFPLHVPVVVRNLLHHHIEAIGGVNGGSYARGFFLIIQVPGENGYARFFGNVKKARFPLRYPRARTLRGQQHNELWVLLKQVGHGIHITGAVALGVGASVDPYRTHRAYQPADEGDAAQFRLGRKAHRQSHEAEGRHCIHKVPVRGMGRCQHDCLTRRFGGQVHVHGPAIAEKKPLKECLKHGSGRFRG